MLSWLRPRWYPARGDPAQVGASCPAALPFPRGPQGGHSQRRCCLSAPPTGEERVGKRGVTGFHFHIQHHCDSDSEQKRKYTRKYTQPQETILVLSLYSYSKA